MDFEPLDPESEASSSRKKAVGLVAGGLAVIGLLGGMVYSFLQNSGPTNKRVVHEIALVKPPPPPPPKPEIKPPEPEMKKEEVKLEQPKMDEPKPLDNEPPPLKDLGVVGEGVAGGDAFGLEARTGGADLLQTANMDIGNGKGGGDVAPMAPSQGGPIKTPSVETNFKMPTPKKNYGWYTVQIQQHIQDALAGNDGLQGATYKIVLRVWLNEDGSIKRTDLVNSSGDEKTDSSLRQALKDLPKLAEVPPEDLPQPIRLRITSRT